MVALKDDLLGYHRLTLIERLSKEFHMSISVHWDDPPACLAFYIKYRVHVRKIYGIESKFS